MTQGMLYKSGGIIPKGYTGLHRVINYSNTLSVLIVQRVTWTSTSVVRRMSLSCVV